MIKTIFTISLYMGRTKSLTGQISLTWSMYVWDAINPKPITVSTAGWRKSVHLCQGSRNLVAAIWLISTPCARLSIFRNFQVCGDFYNVTKCIGVMVEQSIVRDTYEVLLLGRLVIFIVVRFFEFIKKCWFQFLNCFRIREPSVLVVWKQRIRIKEPLIPVISNPFKEPPVFMIEPTKNW